MAPSHPHPDTPHRDTEADDLRLLKRLRAGDRSAMGELLTRYQDRLFGVCFRMLGDRDAAADLTQDAMVKIIQGVASFDGSSRVSTWMIKVAMNACLSHLRGEKLRRHAPLESSGVGETHGSGGIRAAVERGSLGTTGGGGGREQRPEQGVQHQEEQQLLLLAMDSLDPDQRALLILRDVQGLEYDQIADTIGVPVGTIKSRLFRARLALRERVEHIKAGKVRAPAPRDE